MASSLRASVVTRQPSREVGCLTTRNAARGRTRRAFPFGAPHNTIPTTPPSAHQSPRLCEGWLWRASRGGGGWGLNGHRLSCAIVFPGGPAPCCGRHRLRVRLVTTSASTFRRGLARVAGPRRLSSDGSAGARLDVSVRPPGAGGVLVPGALGLTGRPWVACVSRMVPRRARHPDHRLVRKGEEQSAARRPWLGWVRRRPFAPMLRLLAAQHLDVAGDVIFTGPVPWRTSRLLRPEDVFAMPCPDARGPWLGRGGPGIVLPLKASATACRDRRGLRRGAGWPSLTCETGYGVHDVAGWSRPPLTEFSATRPGPLPWEKSQAVWNATGGRKLSAAALSADPAGEAG